MTQFRFCPSCGTEATPGGSFCGGCGHALTTARAGISSQQTQPDSDTPPRPLPTSGVKITDKRGMSSAPPAARPSSSKQQKPPKGVFVPSTPFVPGDPLANVRRYKDHRVVLCLFCGYSGPMGVIRRKRPWYANPILLVAFLLTGIGFFVLLALALMGALSTVFELECPKCGRHVVSPPGGKL